MPLKFAEVISRWRMDKSFRQYFNQLLMESPFTAFRWETPSLSFETQDNDFEFVLVNTPRFAKRKTDKNTFRSKFTTSEDDFGVVNFSNLSGDATMIVPSPRTEITAYGHLAAFVRNAPNEQIDTLWRMVGDVAKLNIDEKPFWLNTAGGGVAWLHVRFDSRPKYYSHKPYKNAK